MTFEPCLPRVRRAWGYEIAGIGPGMVNVICFKWGPKYGPETVNTLYSMVQRHLSVPHRFVCFTDDAAGVREEVEIRDLPDLYVPQERQISPWRKVGIFMPGLGGLEGRTLFLDLDVVVTGPLDDLLTYSDKLAIPENWTQPGQGVGNSSVFTFDIGKFAYIVERYKAEVDTLFDHFPNSQTFVSRTAAEHGDLEFFPPEWIRSFKVNCMPGGLLNWVKTPVLPDKARVIAFHGDPKPEDALKGVYPGKWYKTVRPTPWIKEHYR